MSTLNQYIKGVAFKYLSSVDSKVSSNQHEVGSNKFRKILGDPGHGAIYFDATFLFFDPELEGPISCTDTVTYYDSRRYQKHRTPELRLYYKDNPVTEQFGEGDFFLVAMLTSGRLLIATARPDTEEERRLRYLFVKEGGKDKWVVESEMPAKEIGLAAGQILDALGIEWQVFDDGYLGRMIDIFEGKFPPTRIFSEFSRQSISITSCAVENPDATLELWMEREEVLFRTLERAIVSERLEEGFSDVDDFVRFSLSVQNRRKSRVGHAFENHLEAIFIANSLSFDRGALTERKSRPDFLFPGGNYYRQEQATSPPLRMLAAKTTCKDRWRQVLAEAEKIREKHLITLETAISENQTDEMREHGLQLVVPGSVIDTYTPSQRSWIQSLGNFICIIKRGG